MPSRSEPVVREAVTTDVPAICRFGAEVVPDHYTPLIGAQAAMSQVRHWWSEAHITAAATDGRLVVAEDDGRVVGVAQRGRFGDEHVIYKLYVRPSHRGTGLGPRLMDALVRGIPPDAERVLLEHFAANERAAAFYEREGFTVERVDPDPGGNRALDVVWRARPKGGSPRTRDSKEP